MNSLSLGEIKTLSQHRYPVCVSLYMPTHRTDPEQEQDPIRFRNLCQRAEKLLIDSGLPEENAKKLLKPVKKLDQYEFWQHQSDGLAIFFAQDCLQYYHLPIRCEEQVITGNHFYIKPLLPLVSHDGRFLILALSQQQIRLFQGNRYSVSEVELPNRLPSLSDFLSFEPEEREVPAHMGSPGVPRQRGATVGGVVFHGHGAGEADEKERLRLYFCHVDEQLQPLLHQDPMPLVLAAVDSLVAIYRQASDYPQLIGEFIAGNPELSSAEELHTQALSIVQPYFRQAQSAAITRYERLNGTGRASSNLQEIIPAAVQGRIDCLFVAIDQQQWGCIDLNNPQLELHADAQPGDQELLDYAAAQTLLNQGTIYTLKQEDMPDHAILAAIFRY